MTSTTTTTMLNGNGAGSQSQRLNRVSLDSSQLQGQNRSRQDLFDNPRRILQSQISQLSSVGDAHSLLEADLPYAEDHMPMHHQQHPTMCSIDELSCQNDDSGLSRSRLKLTRITRPMGGVAARGSGAGSVGGDESSGKVRKAKAKTLKSSNTLKGLRAKFNWRARRKGSHKPQARGATVAGVSEAPAPGCGNDSSDERAAFWRGPESIPMPATHTQLWYEQQAPLELVCVFFLDKYSSSRSILCPCFNLEFSSITRNRVSIN